MGWFAAGGSGLSGRSVGSFHGWLSEKRRGRETPSSSPKTFMFTMGWLTAFRE